MAITTLTSQDFARTVEDNEIVLVDFWAAWWGPRRMFAPVYEQAAQRYADREPSIVFGKVDTDAEQALVAAAQITSIPTLMAFKRGHVVFAQPGALPAAALDQVIDAVVGFDVEAALAAAVQECS